MKIIGPCDKYFIAKLTSNFNLTSGQELKSLDIPSTLIKAKAIVAGFASPLQSFLAQTIPSKHFKQSEATHEILSNWNSEEFNTWNSFTIWKLECPDVNKEADRCLFVKGQYGSASANIAMLM